MSVVSVPSLARKRWRRAYAATYGWTALCSLYSRVSLNKDNSNKLLRSPSYTIIDVEPDRFYSIDAFRLTKLVREGNVNLLLQLGWVEGVAQALKSNPENGIDGHKEDIVRRRRDFGCNTYPGPRAKSFYSFFLEAYREPMILILLVCAALSAGFSFKNHGLWKGWFEGVIKFVGVSVVATVFAGSKFWPHMHSHWLSEACYNQIQVDVSRNSQRQKISMSDIVVGDVVFLKPDDQVPANGLLLSMQTLQGVKSDIAGQKVRVQIHHLSYPFLLYGTRVLDGYGRMLVTTVGLTAREDGECDPFCRIPSEQTLLQIRIRKLNSFVGMAGQAVAFLVLLVTLVCYFTGNMHDERTETHRVFVATLGILATPLMIALMAAPDGLSLAFSISLVYSMKRMMDHGVVVRDLSFARTIRAVTTLCASKTGTLTLDQMNVTKFWLGLSSVEDSNSISPNVLELLQVGIGLNKNPPTFDILSDSTEKAIFEWAIKRLGMDTIELSDSRSILKIEAFKSEKRKSEVLIRYKDSNTIYVHRKGAPEVILGSCSRYYETNGDIKLITDIVRERMEQILKGMTEIGLRCIAFAYKQIQDDKFSDENLEEGLKTDDWTLLGFVGLQNPCAPGVKAAVRSCYKAGLDVKMITGDDILTATAIASECGILESDQPGLVIIEGAKFENYTPEERLEKVDNIRVMARASPFQKFLMVESLKRNNRSVVFVGHSIGDRMALWESDIGFCLRHHGTVPAERSSDMVIRDGQFTSAVTALLRWDRGMLENIQIFIQFHLTATIVSLMIDSITAMSSGDPPTIDFVASLSSGKVPYPALQLLWVKLIMGPLAARALIFEQSFEELIQKQPRQRIDSLVSYITWRNTLFHVLYQITVLLTIHFKGKSFFNADSEVKSTLIFNVFVLCQVFNLLGARFIDKNSFKEIHRKKLFGGLIAIMIVVQVVVVEFLKKFADTTRLGWVHWCISIGIAAGSWLIGWLVNHLPARKERFFGYHMRDSRKYKTL